MSRLVVVGTTTSLFAGIDGPWKRKKQDILRVALWGFKRSSLGCCSAPWKFFGAVGLILYMVSPELFKDEDGIEGKKDPEMCCVSDRGCILL